MGEVNSGLNKFLYSQQKVVRGMEKSRLFMRFICEMRKENLN